MNRKNEFKVSFFSQPFTWLHDRFEHFGNSVLQMGGDLIRGTHTPIDELENSSTPKGIDKNKEGGKPIPQQEETYDELQELKFQRKKELELKVTKRKKHNSLNRSLLQR